MILNKNVILDLLNNSESLEFFNLFQASIKVPNGLSYTPNINSWDVDEIHSGWWVGKHSLFLELQWRSKVQRLYPPSLFLDFFGQTRCNGDVRKEKGARKNKTNLHTRGNGRLNCPLRLFFLFDVDG